MPIYAFEGKRPAVAATAWVAPTATVIGSVTVGERCYVGPGAILRGDYGSIEIGDETAVEEGVIIHARPQDTTRIGRRVTLGHGAMVHNATLHDGAVIGMRAVVSDYAVVGEGAVVGELALVRARQEIPAGKVALGVPSKVVRDVGDQDAAMTRWAKELYVSLAERYLAGALVELPQTEAELPRLRAIGTIHTPFTEPKGTPVQGAFAGDAEGEVLVDPAYAEGLADLDGFSHVVVLYAFDRSEGFSLTVTPYLDDSRRGLFSTRAPRRPNPIGTTVVRLLAVEENRLRVAGVDMLDGTPLLDLKPYVPAFDEAGEARTGWLEPHLEAVREGRATPPRADGRFHEGGA